MCPSCTCIQSMFVVHIYKTYNWTDWHGIVPFIKEEEFCDYVGFIDKGLFNYFYLINGIQHIRGFFFVNNFISNYPCFLLNNKSKVYIQALEDSSVTLIHKNDLFLLYEKLPIIQKLSRNIVENLFCPQ